MGNRNTAVLYSSAVCNLRCTYCYINKNPALMEIDSVLAKSYEDPNYYFDFIKEYFPERGSLEKLEVWGAETFIKMERVHPVLRKLIEYYPFFRQFFASTNFSYPEWTDKVFGLLNVFAEYPDRRFDVTFQMSLDGPEAVTDATRGAGTTAKCLENFERLLKRVDEIPGNTRVTLAFKPTLSIDTIYKLDSKDAIIEYYQFFERLIREVRRLGRYNFTVNTPIPNVGVPVPAKKEDGVYFASLVKNCREIEDENRERGYFEFYNEITPFTTNVRPYKFNSYNYPCFNCGTGSSVVGFLPNGLVSSCHNGFVDLLEDYERQMREDPDMSIDRKIFKPTHSRFTHTKEQYKEYERQIAYYNCGGSMCRLAALAGFIRTLALAGEIDGKYATEEGAYNGALMFQSCTCNCLRDNYMVTGSTLMPPEGMIILLLNGAAELIMRGSGCGEGDVTNGCA